VGKQKLKQFANKAKKIVAICMKYDYNKKEKKLKPNWLTL